MRRDEAPSLRWRDLDLERGVIRLDENKTDDPRAWALDASVARALKLWRDHFQPKEDPSETLEQQAKRLANNHVFRDEGRPLYGGPDGRTASNGPESGRHDACRAV
jgi:integrase